MRKFLPILFLLLVIIPIFANAEIIPCGGCAKWEDPDNPTKCVEKQADCGYADLLKLVNNIIKWIILISVPIAAGVFAWAGIKYMTTGVVDQKAEAKAMLWKVFIGFVFILSAWIIVNTITNALLREGPTEAERFRSSVPVE